MGEENRMNFRVFLTEERKNRKKEEDMLFTLHISTSCVSSPKMERN